MSAPDLAARVADLEQQAADRERAFAQATEFQYQKSDEREAALKAEVSSLTEQRDRLREAARVVMRTALRIDGLTDDGRGGTVKCTAVPLEAWRALGLALTGGGS